MTEGKREVGQTKINIHKDRGKGTQTEEVGQLSQSHGSGTR